MKRLGVIVGAVLTCVALLGGPPGAAATATHKSRAVPAVDCQPFAGTPCLLPFPNNLFTQISAFLVPSGAVVNVCGGRPCHTSVYTP